MHADDNQSLSRSPTQGSSIVNSKRDNGDGYFTDLVVQAASLCNRMIVERCGMCTVYCDKQIQYEVLSQELHHTAEATKAVAMTNFYYQNNQEVQMARGHLFDEDSVVDSISSRE